MKEFGFQLAGLLVLIFVTMWVIFNPAIFGGFLSPAGNRSSNGNPSGTKQIAIISNDGSTTKATISIEVADTPDKRGLGLGNRNSLDSNSGMIFVFSQPGNYDFWMKGMRFPLDFIWIYSDEVVDVTENAPAPAENQAELPLFHSSKAVDKVLEVNAGYIKEHKITPGDRIRQLN